MSKVSWKGTVLLAPVPAAIVSCRDITENGGERENALTVGWCGVLCSHPPKTYISLRPLYPGATHAKLVKKGGIFMWFVFALGSAVFAALTSILAKIGIEGVNSTLATAIRTVVVLAMSWGMVFLTGTQTGIGDISRRSWLFLILSGLATGASWLCYYHALQIGAASKVVPIDKLSVVITLALAFIVLREPVTAKNLIGCALITAGTLFMVL